MRTPYQVLSILCLGLALYLPGIGSGYFIFDDLQIITALREQGWQGFSFLPTEGNIYLRPVLMATFLLDVLMWDAHPGIMHLENVCVHIANTLLVFSITRQLTAATKETRRALPLLTALLFLVHPACTEAVNWIAGRSDLLAAFFVLLGINLLIPALKTGRFLHLAGASASLLAGSLCKEIAIFVLPGVLVTFLFHRAKPLTAARPNILPLLKELTPFILAGGAYLAIRTRGFTLFDRSVNAIVSGENAATGDRMTSSIDFFSAFGFYLKKLWLPFPLNFAIDQVPATYAWLAFLLLPLAFIVVWRRDLRGGLLLCLLLCLVPTAINAQFNIAWTPYADRYLYLPAAFFSLLLPLLSTSPAWQKKWSTGLVLLLLISFLPQTIQRNIAWSDPFLILEDAYRKNPDNPRVRRGYAVLLSDRGQPQRAYEELQRLLQEQPADHKVRYSIARIALEELHDAALAYRSLDIYYSGTQQPTETITTLMKQVDQQFAGPSLRLDRYSE